MTKMDESLGSFNLVDRMRRPSGACQVPRGWSALYRLSWHHAYVVGIPTSWSKGRPQYSQLETHLPFHAFRI